MKIIAKISVKKMDSQKEGLKGKTEQKKSVCLTLDQTTIHLNITDLTTAFTGLLLLIVRYEKYEDFPDKPLYRIFKLPSPSISLNSLSANSLSRPLRTLYSLIARFLSSNIKYANPRL